MDSTGAQSRPANQQVAAPDEPQAKTQTRRAFIERLAKTSAIPVVLPLTLSMSTAALAS